METLPLYIGTRALPDTRGMQQRIAYVEELVAKGGPEPAEYDTFSAWLDDIAYDLRVGRLSKADLAVLRDAFGDALSRDTLQGFSFSKPHGYSGDFEIIDRIYRGHVSERWDLTNWDHYCHAQSGPKAVRNRKSYFVDLLRALEKSSPSHSNISVLNVASGPCRDLLEYFSAPRRSDVRMSFECIDSDPQAIEFAGMLCSSFQDQVGFTRANALRFTSDNSYDLIWSAGLFDYLEDKVFRFLLRKLLVMLADGGELVVGNFAEGNPTRSYMEIVGDWNLYHRSEERLIELAVSCGVDASDVRVGRESEGVNLFLHVKRGPRFIG